MTHRYEEKAKSSDTWSTQPTNTNTMLQTVMFSATILALGLAGVFAQPGGMPQVRPAVTCPVFFRELF